MAGMGDIVPPRPPISPSMRVAAADAELNFQLPSSRTTAERQQSAISLSLVAIAQLLEAQNHLLERIADVMQRTEP